MDLRRTLTIVGPGIAIAATGVGAGDLLAAMVAGSDFGTTVLWVIFVGALLKFSLNEGIARWQLATDTTLLEGWCRHLGRPFQIYFLLYLVIWSFIVAGGLMSACGVAAHALLPQLGIAAWGIVHSLVAVVLVLLGRYSIFEGIMKWLIGLMVLTLVASVILIGPAWGELWRGLVVPVLPKGSSGTLLSLMGGVGGSVTLLSYGYWIREKGLSGSERLGDSRIDLAVGYGLTALFGAAMLILAATALGSSEGGLPPGSQGLVACADAIGAAATARFSADAGTAARMVFLVGVWAAIATSTLGVWQGVPYLFADYLDAFRGRFETDVDVRGWSYRGYLLYLAVPPMLLLAFDRPLWIIRLYTLTSGLFMPFLAASLLWLTAKQKLMGDLRSGALARGMLILSLLLFGVITARKIVDMISAG